MQAILQKVHFSYVYQTFEECICISGTVLFQGLQYSCSKSSPLRRMCPSCPPVHMHRTADWTCKGLNFSEKLCVGPGTHTQRLACADLFNSAYQGASSEKGTARPLVL